MTTSAKLAMTAAVAEASLRGSAGHVRDDRRREAFERLVRDHASRVHALARRLGPRGEAEDLVQETFVRAWRGLHRFRREAELGTWLYRILLNLCRDRFRRLAQREKVPPTPAGSVDPALRAARRDLLDRVLLAVDDLPPRQREALWLRVRAELSYADIASVMGVRKGSVKSHLVAARRALVERFGDAVGGEGGLA